jgi:translation initiation factor IF-1
MVKAPLSMLCAEMFAVCSENREEYMAELCGRSGLNV